MTDNSLTNQEIVELAAQPTLAVRIRKPMADLDLRELFDTQLPRLFELATSQGQPPMGAPYARYYMFGPDEADIEIGVPTAQPVTGLASPDDQLREAGASSLPSGKVAKLVHHGSYKTLSQAYDSLHQWIHEQGEDDGVGPWEVYVTDPSAVADPSELKTEIYWPLA